MTERTAAQQLSLTTTNPEDHARVSVCRFGFVQERISVGFLIALAVLSGPAPTPYHESPHLHPRRILHNLLECSRASK